MRSIRAGKSSVTTFTWMPIFWRSSWIMRHVLRGGRELVEVFAIESVDQVNFVALEAEHLHVAVRLNVQLYGVEVRQLAALLVGFPVVRISFQKDRRARFVIGDHEG